MPDIAAARPSSGAPVETAWGSAVHDAVENVQAGSVLVPAPGTAGPVGTVTVTFPRPFAVAPIVVACAFGSATGLWIIGVGTVTTTTVTLYSSRRDGANVSNISAMWQAIPAG